MFEKGPLSYAFELDHNKETVEKKEESIGEAAATREIEEKRHEGRNCGDKCGS